MVKPLPRSLVGRKPMCGDGLPTCHRLCGATFASRDHNEQFHHIVVDSNKSVGVAHEDESFLLATATLYDEDVLVADGSICQGVSYM